MIPMPQTGGTQRRVAPAGNPNSAFTRASAFCTLLKT
jgi:hypothetical protein